MYVNHKDEMIAFDRERRVYKDAYVENFRRVRYFPSLSTIGAGRSDGESIILVQEPNISNTPVTIETPRCSKGSNATTIHSRTDTIDARVHQIDSLDQVFHNTPPLTNFRAAVMCKHINARKVNQGSTSSNNSESQPSSAFESPRYSTSLEKVAFKPSGSAEAKATIERRLSYDSDEFIDRHKVGRSPSAPIGKAQWALNNPNDAKQRIRNTAYFHAPMGETINANRAYTQAFIKQHVEAYQHSRRR